MLNRELASQSKYLHVMAKSQPRTPGDSKLQPFIDSLSLFPDMISAKVYNLDKEVVWSTQESQVGLIFTDDLDLLDALQGKNVYEIEDATHHAKSEHNYLPIGTKEFVESYIPVRDRDSGAIIGVVETYKYPQALFDTLAEGKILVVQVSLAGSALLFLFLFWIVSSANNTITRQRDRLHFAREKSIARNERFLTRTGAELHDGPCQAIGFALLRLDNVVSCTDTEPDTKNKEASRIRDALLDALHEIRNLSAGLAIPELSKLNAKEAILLAVERHCRRTLLPVEADIAELPDNLELSLKMCLYRVAQEALNNTYKHASDADVSVSARTIKNKIILTIKDNGSGLPTGSEQHVEEDSKLGLAGMRDRVESVGGKLVIESYYNQGVEVSAHIPCSSH